LHHQAGIIIEVYSLLVLVGGYFGYKKKKSVPSLVAGIVSAVLLDVACIGEFFGHTWGLYLAFLIAFFLMGFFASRFLRSPDHAFMPGGLMTIVSLLTLVGLYLTH
jgi:uncharacterized membrane protein (UPF0136 family)